MGRLMKYDLRSALRLFIPLWLGLLALALVNGLSFSEDFYFYTFMTDNYLLRGLRTLMMLLYFLAVFGIVVFAYIYIVMRFYQSTMKDEAYLTFTLPISIDAVLMSKALTALILMTCSVLVFALSLALMFMRQLPWSGLLDALTNINHNIDGYLPHLAIGYCVILPVSMLSGILQIYLSMAIGQLSSRYRVLVSVLAYVGINTVLSGISNLAMLPSFYTMIENADTFTVPAFMESPGGVILLVLIVALVVSLVSCALFYFPTRYIFRNKLNLT